MKRKETRLRALALRGQLSLRFLRVMLPTIALLLLLQLITYQSAAPSDRAALAPQLLLRVECLLHCLAVSMGGCRFIGMRRTGLHKSGSKQIRALYRLKASVTAGFLFARRPFASAAARCAEYAR